MVRSFISSVSIAGIRWKVVKLIVLVEVVVIVEVVVVVETALIFPTFTTFLTFTTSTTHVNKRNQSMLNKVKSIREKYCIYFIVFNNT